MVKLPFTCGKTDAATTSPNRLETTEDKIALLKVIARSATANINKYGLRALFRPERLKRFGAPQSVQWQNANEQANLNVQYFVQSIDTLLEASPAHPRLNELAENFEQLLFSVYSEGTSFLDYNNIAFVKIAENITDIIKGVAPDFNTLLKKHPHQSRIGDPNLVIQNALSYFIRAACVGKSQELDRLGNVVYQPITETSYADLSENARLVVQAEKGELAKLECSVGIGGKGDMIR